MHMFYLYLRECTSEKSLLSPLKDMELHSLLFSEMARYLFLLLPFLLVVAPQPATSAAADTSTDLSSLLAFKASIDDSHILASNWTTDTSFCNWIGVSCRQQHQHQQRVVSLNLSSFSLQGTIAPHLANLSFLSSLDLSNNSLSGPVPRSLGRLPQLVTLILSQNLLSGPIPPAIFNMSSLVSIDLSVNSISGSIPRLVILPRIVDMLMMENSLTGEIPHSLAGCSKLKQIMLEGNMLTGTVPSSLGNLSEVVQLTLGRNNFTGEIPTSFGNLTKIRSLVIDSNYMEGEIPGELGNLANLQSLNLGRNGFSGSIPISLLNASAMIMLHVSSNNLTGPVPSTLGKSMPSLRRLHMAGNALSGGLEFIASLTNCRDLQDVEVMENQFEGVIPDACGNLSANLLYFHVSENRIGGSIPAGLGNLTNMISLALSGNELHGTIPPTIWRLSKLQVMYLGVNGLTGSIPSDIGRMTSMAKISLSQNKLSGPVPETVGNLSRLQFFAVAVNELSSSIPLSLWSITGLVTLDLYQNQFEGIVPPEMANLKAVDYIDLWSNRLSGNIPNALGELQTITYLDLSNNSLHGQIPQQLGRLFSIKYLNLSHNFLSGVVPESFLNLSYVNSLDLSFNMLEGQIPEGKVFSNDSIVSLIGNPALCGAHRLQFPPCPAAVATSNSKRKRRLLKYVLLPVASALVFLACICLFLHLYMRRKANDSSQEESPCLNYHRWISYFELSRATDNFSEANLLGSGAFGKVYKGSLDDGLVVAVKVLNLEVEGASRSFDAECRTLGKVRHRNIVKIISTCSNQEFKALVLEFMPNQSLDRWLHSPSHYMTLLQRINVMVDVASALDYLHHQHDPVIVHCDLKPNNILLDDNMVAHVSDFGIAKLVLVDSKSLVSGNGLGTIGYMAPEYGSTGGITRRGDVYSFGILVLELITGKKPVDAMFSEELNLRQWVCNSYPADVLETVDRNILRNDFANTQHSDEVSNLHRCLSSIVELGLNCSKESPKERLLMKNVVPRLEGIKNKILVELKLD